MCNPALALPELEARCEQKDAEPLEPQQVPYGGAGARQYCAAGGEVRHWDREGHRLASGRRALLEAAVCPDAKATSHLALETASLRPCQAWG